MDNSNEIIMLCTNDFGAQTRGKGFAAKHFDKRLKTGIGWSPGTNMITAIGPTAPNPWGALGDLVLRPDAATRVRVEGQEGRAALHFVLCDLMNLDGTAWAACPRHFAKRMLAELEQRYGLQLKAAFEHEFIYQGAAEQNNSSYALDAFARQGLFGQSCFDALEAAGLVPDSFMPEYAPQQYELTIEPAIGIRAADQAIQLREIVREVARRFGSRVSFTPILRPDVVGNGVHLHFSLWDAENGQPLNYDATQANGLSKIAGSFVAGILACMPALTAITAAASVSYLRLRPGRWSAAYNNLGDGDREAGMRICPIFDESNKAAQFHFEYRAADASANPWLMLGALVAAGLYGLDAGLAAPETRGAPPPNASADLLQALGIERLPQSLPEALDRFAADTRLAQRFGSELKEAYVLNKRFEYALMRDLSAEEQCQRYAAAY